MKTVTKEYQVYQFNELSEEARNKAINDTIQFFMEVFSYEELSVDMQRAVDKAESMQTPWFAGEYIMEYADGEIIDFCEQYDYLESGEIFS